LIPEAQKLDFPHGSTRTLSDSPLIKIFDPKPPIGGGCIFKVSIPKHAAAVQPTSELAQVEQTLLTVERRVNANIVICDRWVKGQVTRGRVGERVFACLMILVDYILHFSLCGFEAVGILA
jgi:hypothetical protein